MRLALGFLAIFLTAACGDNTDGNTPPVLQNLEISGTEDMPVTRGLPVTDADGTSVADTDLTDYENVPLLEDVRDYLAREVLPHVPDAWIDHDKTKVGYEIPFNRHFYKYVPPRPLEVIDAELKALSAEIMTILTEVTA